MGTRGNSEDRAQCCGGFLPVEQAYRLISPYIPLHRGPWFMNVTLTSGVSIYPGEGDDLEFSFPVDRSKPYTDPLLKEPSL
jgi:hypothetical protein